MIEYVPARETEMVGGKRRRKKFDIVETSPPLLLERPELVFPLSNPDYFQQQRGTA